jgi:choline dehydrogenase-like flavoprotein
VIVDVETQPAPQDVEADVCIVGAGAAGITLALELERRARSVVLLEGGGLHRDDFSTGLYRGVAEAPALANVGAYLTASRLRYLGGSTNHWAGWCRPLDPLDFETREWIPHSGWPFGRAVLEPYYPRASELVQIEASERAAGSALPLADFPGDDGAFERARFQLSPPTRFGQAYRPALSQSRTTRLLLHANVVRIATEASGERVTHLEARTPGGREFRVGATTVVLATGGIENARLLLASNQARPEGLGNGHDRVGRFFMDHPHVSAGYVAFTAPPDWIEPFDFHRPAGARCDAIDVLSLRASAQRELRLPNVDVHLQRSGRARSGSVPEAPDAVGAAARAFAAVDALARPDERAPTQARLRVRLEPLPNPDSRVVLDREKDALGMPRARLRWRLTPGDASNLETAVETLARQLGRARWGRAQRLEIPGEPWPATGWAGHHMGTTRMHADPRQGVVDADGRVHELANLYVAGSSVFPTVGAANPTLTIVALALRLAEHLGGEAPA